MSFYCSVQTCNNYVDHRSKWLRRGKRLLVTEIGICNVNCYFPRSAAFLITFTMSILFCEMSKLNIYKNFAAGVYFCIYKKKAYNRKKGVLPRFWWHFFLFPVCPKRSLQNWLFLTLYFIGLNIILFYFLYVISDPSWRIVRLIKKLTGSKSVDPNFPGETYPDPQHSLLLTLAWLHTTSPSPCRRSNQTPDKVRRPPE